MEGSRKDFWVGVCGDVTVVPPSKPECEMLEPIYVAASHRGPRNLDMRSETEPFTGAERH